MKIPAESLCQTLAINVNNSKLSDAAFRELVRNTLPIVEFRRPTKASDNPCGEIFLSNDDPDGGIDVGECPNGGRYIR
jgi:hypothetical protein